MSEAPKPLLPTWAAVAVVMTAVIALLFVIGEALALLRSALG